MPQKEQRLEVTTAKGKRARPFPTTYTHADRALVNIHQLAYWGQWRLAIHGVCARFDTKSEVETDGWSRLRRDEISIAKQTALCAEVRHLEAQLGRHTSINAKLEALLSERGEALSGLETERVKAIATVDRLQVQLARDQETTAASSRELHDRLSRANIAREEVDARLREAEKAQHAATDVTLKLAQKCSWLEEDLKEAKQRMADLTDMSEAEREKTEALEAEYAALREKYSALKRRMADAGRKVESVRAERDTLRQDRAALEDKLADVEKFQLSERGRALDRMEQELASEKMARVELEADRDDLQTQLAAALQATEQA